MNLPDQNVKSRHFLKSKLLIGRQVGMESYSRSNFTQGKWPVVKSSRSIAGHPPEFPDQMSGKRL